MNSYLIKGKVSYTKILTPECGASKARREAKGFTRAVEAEDADTAIEKVLRSILNKYNKKIGRIVFANAEILTYSVYQQIK